jgi:hypothetical protein
MLMSAMITHVGHRYLLGKLRFSLCTHGEAAKLSSPRETHSLGPFAFPYVETDRFSSVESVFLVLVVE